jgi:hypothetical protein
MLNNLDVFTSIARCSKQKDFVTVILVVKELLYPETQKPIQSRIYKQETKQFSGCIDSVLNDIVSFLLDRDITNILTDVSELQIDMVFNQTSWHTVIIRSYNPFQSYIVKFVDDDKHSVVELNNSRSTNDIMPLVIPKYNMVFGTLVCNKLFSRLNISQF